VAITRRSKNVASIDRFTFVTGHSTLVGWVAIRERLLAPLLINWTRPGAT
jgi:hypothetical protein